MTTKVTSSLLADTTATPGTYGGTTQYSVVTVDQQGRITYVANATPSIATTQLTGTITNAQLAGSITSDKISSVANTTITGTITNAQLAGSITTDKLTGLATSATTDTTNASNIASGTLSAARLPTGVVTAGSSGGSTAIPVVTVDTTGRVTNITTVSPSVATTQLTGTVGYSQLSADVTTTLSPTGVIHMWPTAAAPTGFLLCDGSAVSRTTYNKLYVLIGTTFGAGNGSTTFNLPNYVNRFPIGSGTTAALGTTGGSADAIVVSHTHTITDSGHQHNTSVTGHLLFDYNGAENVTYGGPGNYPGTTFSMSNATTGISVNTAGVSGVNQNLPPYLGINFIIKT